MQVEFPREEKVTSVLQGLYPYRFWVIAFVFAIIGGGFLLIPKNTFMKEYLTALRLVQTLKEGKGLEKGTLAPILHAHPELSPLFDHYLEESLVLGGEVKEGVAVGEKTLDRLSFFEGPHLGYAKTTLLIESGQLEAALQATCLLDQEMKREEYPRLYFFNLVRKASLEEKLAKESSKESWNKVKMALEESGDDQLKAELRSHFSDDQATLF